MVLFQYHWFHCFKFVGRLFVSDSDQRLVTKFPLRLKTSLILTSTYRTGHNVCLTVLMTRIRTAQALWSEQYAHFKVTASIHI